MLTKLFTVKTIFAFIVLYRCAYNFNFATEPFNIYIFNIFTPKDKRIKSLTLTIRTPKN